MPRLETHAEVATVPADLEAEMSVIGGMLIDAEAIPRATDLLEADDFHREAHRLLFAAMVDLHGSGVAVDPVTLRSVMGDRYQAAGGAAYLAELWDYVPSAANLEHHARIVAEKAQLRRYRAIAADLAWHVDQGHAAAEVQERAEHLFFAAGRRASAGAPMVPVKTTILETFERMQAGEAHVATGFEDVDRMTLGMARGDLLILAARPSMGKTSYALQVATNVASGADKPGAVAVFSLEMSREALTRRMLFTEARIDGVAFTRDPREHDYARLAQAAAWLNPLPLYLQDRVQTVRDIRTHCRRLALERKQRLGLVVVDYLGKLRGTRGTESRVHELGEITGDLKQLAVEMDCPVLALCQLSRKVEERPDKRPQMSDLRDSGEIEQDADAVWFLYRPEYYFGPTDKDGNSLVGRAELLVGKQRNGATGDVSLAFHAEHTRFATFSGRREP